jgi:quinol monooxygenase YgiN
MTNARLISTGLAAQLVSKKQASPLTEKSISSPHPLDRNCLLCHNLFHRPGSFLSLHRRKRRPHQAGSDRSEAMAITVNLRYRGTNGSALSFAREMSESGTVNAIRAEAGNLRYEYFQSLEDPETILLIDSWRNQNAIDAHHASPMMQTIARLREKYDLHMSVERYISAETPDSENRFIRK